MFLEVASAAETHLAAVLTGGFLRLVGQLVNWAVAAPDNPGTAVRVTTDTGGLQLQIVAAGHVFRAELLDQRLEELKHRAWALGAVLRPSEDDEETSTATLAFMR